MLVKTSLVTTLCAAMLATTAAYPTQTMKEFANRLPRPEERTVVLPDAAELNKLEDVLLTHYCICEKCCGKSASHPEYGITHSGRVAEPYKSVAVDPNIIPLGSTVWLVYEDGEIVECRADDTGGAIDGARIDLCVSSHSEAWELGIADITVYWKEANEMPYSDDPAADFARHDAEQTKWLEKLPVCVECDHPIQDEHCYEINDELICEECLKNNHRKNTDDYVE